MVPPILSLLTPPLRHLLSLGCPDVAPAHHLARAHGGDLLCDFEQIVGSEDSGRSGEEPGCQLVVTVNGEDTSYPVRSWTLDNNPCSLPDKFRVDNLVVILGGGHQDFGDIILPFWLSVDRVSWQDHPEEWARRRCTGVSAGLLIARRADTSSRSPPLDLQPSHSGPSVSRAPGQAVPATPPPPS